MGNTSSRPDEAGALYLKDQTKLAIASLTITNSRGNVLLNIVPNAYPATRITAKREPNDDTPIEYIQDPDSASSGVPSFLLKLTNDDELNFRFSFVIRQNQTGNVATSTINGVSSSLPEVIDTSLKGLTFAHASNLKELDNLVTREFHANPNLQNNSNVQHVGNFSTAGNPSVQFDWSWKWRPPRQAEDKGGGWRNCCSFLEYDERTNRLNTLATFAFWVNNSYRAFLSPQVPSPSFDMAVPQRYRVASSQSAQSKMSEPVDPVDTQPPPTPPEAGENTAAPPPAAAQNSVVDVTCQRPGEDMSLVEDGPLFRATMKALEQKTGNMRAKMKKVLKKAEAANQAQIACNDAVNSFITALNDASTSNANAIQPALEHYFEKIAREILRYEQQNTTHLQRLVIEPLSKLYNFDIKQAESKKKDFEDESRDYYAFVGRYLGQRQDSLKEKKRAESDSKYQAKRRNFELKRFDYSSFMQDLHGGRKEQEVLSHLTKYAETQANSYLSAAKKVEEMVPQLQALIHEVSQADKEYQFQRTEREEKRRALEKSTKKYIEPDTVSNPGGGTVSSAPSTGNAGVSYTSDSDLGRADSTGSTFKGFAGNNTMVSPGAGVLGTSTGSTSDRFRGIRDLEDRDPLASVDRTHGEHKKEGLLWALSRPGSHIDPKGINKQAWHKFWIVLDQGKLSEYSNWKQKLDLHMEPIDLRMASVREARNAERRFCFEVITPQYKRIYQATSEEDMNAWITAVNNALQSAVEGRTAVPPVPQQPDSESARRRDIGSVLTGKSSSLSGHHGHSNTSAASGVTASSGVNRRTTVGARPSYVRNDSNYEDNPSKLLQTIRDADQGNKWCADCGSSSKVEWVSINLGIVLCIECSGIHRSLGTHISKIRSLTLDIHSFSNDIVEILLQVGNRVSNMVWEATLDQSIKPNAQSSREQRLKFITAKYSERAYIQPLSATLSRYATADETLIASIKKNDIQGVLYGIALRANPNVTDRSRGTHAVFLALAAADPASPASTSPVPSSRPKSTQANHSSVKATPFPIAELLVQNGAEIPSQLPAIPLSASAQLYVSQRTAKSTGIGSTGFSRTAISSDGKGNDTVSNLPVIKTTDTSAADGGNNGAGTAPSGVEGKDREKLQKRGSAGARFAGKVASLTG